MNATNLSTNTTPKSTPKPSHEVVGSESGYDRASDDSDAD